MANLPGLTPFREDNPTDSGRRNRGRVVVNDTGPKAPQLRPTANPVDTYARPAQAPIDNDLKNLAEALGSLNPALMHFAKVEQQIDKDELPARIANKYAGKTGPEIAELIKDDPDARTAMGGTLIAKYQARAVASELGREASEHYHTQFDKDGGDLPGYLRGLRQRAMDAHGGNKYFAEEFDRNFGQIEQGIQTQQVKHHVERNNEQVRETIQQGWVGTVDKLFREGKSGPEIATALRESYQANKATLAQSYPDQDKMLLGVMDVLSARIENDPANAKKYLEVVRSIAETDRTGADGTKLGTLRDSTIGPEVTQRIAKAEAAFGQVRDRVTKEDKYTFSAQADVGALDEKALDAFFENPDNKRAMTEQEWRSLKLRNLNAQQAKAAELAKVQAEEMERTQVQTVTNQALDLGDKQQLPWVKDQTILDRNGKPKVVTAKEQREGAVAAMIERERWLVSRDQSPNAEDKSLKRQAEWLARNGEKHPEWEGILKGGAMAGMTVMQGDTLPPVMKQGYELYTKLAGIAPNLAHKMTDDTSREFYEVARVLNQYGQKDPERALMTAIQYNRDPSKFDSLTARQSQQKLNETLEKMGAGGVFGMVGGGDLAGAQNLEVASVPMQKLARIFVTAGGLSAEKALEEAAKVTARNFTVVNGNAVYTADRSIPPNFPKLATQRIEEFATQTATKYGHDKDGLTIRPLPNQPNAWIIVDKATQLPVSFGSDGIVTMDDLARIDAANRAKAEAEAAKQSADRYKPIFTAPGGLFSIDPPKLSGYSPAEVQQLEEERKRANDDAARLLERAQQDAKKRQSTLPDLGKHDTLEEFRARNRKNLGIPDRSPPKKQ